MLGGTRLPRFQAREAAGAPNIFSNNHYVRLPRHALARAARPIHAKTPSRSFGDPGLPRLQAPPPPLPLRLHRKVRYLSPAIRAAAAGEVARRLTSRSHPHKRGLRRRRKPADRAHSTLVHTTHGALSEKAACATFNSRAAVGAHTPQPQKHRAIHTRTHRNRAPSFLASSPAAPKPFPLLLRSASTATSAPFSLASASPPLAR